MQQKAKGTFSGNENYEGDLLIFSKSCRKIYNNREVHQHTACGCITYNVQTFSHGDDNHFFLHVWLRNTIR